MSWVRPKKSTLIFIRQDSRSCRLATATKREKVCHPQPSPRGEAARVKSPVSGAVCQCATPYSVYTSRDRSRTGTANAAVDAVHIVYLLVDYNYSNIQCMLIFGIIGTVRRRSAGRGIAGNLQEEFTIDGLSCAAI